MKKPLFPEGSSPTFSDYFKLDAAMGEILEEFGFGFHRKRCTLPRRDVDEALVEDLQRRWDRTLP